MIVFENFVTLLSSAEYEPPLLNIRVVLRTIESEVITFV